MIPEKDNYGKPTSEFVSRLQEMVDEEFVTATASCCWLSAYANNNPRSDYHWQADACYDEARRREKPWLYQRGWNDAYRQAGYEPSEEDKKAARPT